MVKKNKKKNLNIKSINNTDLCLTMLRIGEMILSSGGEVNRVERTLKKIGITYGADKVDVMALINTIIVTIHRNNETITELRRIEERNFDFYKLKRTNRVYRQMIAKPTHIDEINKKLDLIEKTTKVNNFHIKIISWIITSAFFALFFGGNMIDMIFAAGIGLVLCVIIKILNYFGVNSYFTLIIVSLFGGFLSKILVNTGLNIHTSAINAANIMPLIPGLTLVNSLRDMLSKDTMTGITETFETVVISLVIATGFALTTFNIEAYNEPSYMIYLFSTLFASFGFGLFFNQELVDGLISSIVSAVGLFVMLILKDYHNMEILGYFFAAMAITLLSEILARKRKCPATVFLIQGILILVPGASLYRTMFYYVSNEGRKAAIQGALTLQYAFALAFGILVMTAIVDGIVLYRKH